MAVIKLYNSLSKSKEDFQPIQAGKIGLYSCGPTVYQYAHIGNLRSNLLSDLVRRLFEYNGYKVKQVINITDVGHLSSDADEGEDKMEREASREHKTALEIAAFYLSAWKDDIRQLNIKTEGTIFPRATEHIQEQIDLIKKLEEKNYTYRTSDGIYFDTSRYPKYSELAGLDTEGLREGARVDINPEKHNPTDFALWKFSSPKEKRQQEWDSPWGVGFPGWHIECSAMSMKYLGETFDIHTGGVDLLPVHHTNERAQSECATGQPFANYWLHGAFMTIEGEKMSKSLGNTYHLADLVEKGCSPIAYRLWLLSANYRKTINFTWETALGAQNAYNRLVNLLAEIHNKAGRGKINTDYQKQFSDLIADDLNTPQALALVWDMLKDDSLPPEDKLATMLDFDRFLGLNLETAITEANVEIPDQVKELVEMREVARREKNYSRSDELREEIGRLGYWVDDTDEGPKARKR